MKETYPQKDSRELGLFRFFIKQRVFVNLLFLGVFVLGIILWIFFLNREAFGNFDFDIVGITTPYPGATAEEVEQLITLPLENVLRTVEGIDEMQSVSVEAMSIITLYLDPDSPDKRKVVRNIEREVDQVRTTDLPEDGDEPRVVEVTAAFPVVTVGISGLSDEMELRKAAEDLEDDFLNIDGVSRVSMNGFKSKEIWVEADLKKLQLNHLSLWDLIQAIRQSNHTSPGGRIEVGGKEIVIRTIGKLETVEDVRRVVVRSNEVGRQLFVKDVASVEERLERERKYTRMDGKRSIELSILKKETGDTLSIDRQVKEVVSRYQKEVSPGLQAAYANEISFYIQRRLRILAQNGGFGIFLVLIIMFLFLSPQSAFWSTTAIPFAFLGGIITMYVFGISINLLSLFAFILVCGMLVDNGIVVAEYVEIKRKENIPLFTAVSVGVSEMSLPVFAAGLTTIIAFGTLAFMSGITGKFLRQMPIVLIACLVADLLECLFILPSHLYHYDRPIKFPSIIQKAREKAQAGLQWLTLRYEKIIHRIVGRPFTTILIIIVFLALIGIVSKVFIRFQMFPNIIDQFVINFELPIGTTLDRTEAVASGFEKIVRTLPKDEIETIVTQIGSQGDLRQLNSGIHLGEVRVFLNRLKDRIPGQELMVMIKADVEKWGEESGLVKFGLEEIRGGPPTGRAIEVQLIGDDYTVLQALSGETRKFLEGVKGTWGITDDFDQGKEEIRLVIDREATARAGLDASQVAAVVRSAFDGENATDIKRVGETDDIKVIVKLPEKDRKSTSTLGRLTITTPRGRIVPLRSLVFEDRGKGVLKILRSEGDRTITVRGSVNDKETTARFVNSQLDKFLTDTIKNYPKARYQFSGEEKTQRESMASLAKAIAVAIGLIYLLLATLFKSYWKPLVIISIVPFAVSGVAVALMLRQIPFTLLIGIGFTGLIGVVVNNSILLINSYDRLEDQKGHSVRDAVIEGSVGRLRPIFLTSISTFFGVMPLGFGIGGQEPFLQDMAYSFGFGLLFCSFITVLWIPAVYMAINKTLGTPIDTSR